MPPKMAFSIHESQTRWIKNGQAGVENELRFSALILEDQHQFILRYDVFRVGLESYAIAQFLGRPRVVGVNHVIQHGQRALCVGNPRRVRRSSVVESDARKRWSHLGISSAVTSISLCAGPSAPSWQSIGNQHS